MTYVTIVRVGADAAPTADEADPARWVERADREGRREGHRLADVDAATTVRVRDGRTLVTDGPFAEYKELVGGFDVLDVDDLDHALDLAAAHPAARFGAIEVREVVAAHGVAGTAAFAAEDAGAGYYLLLLAEQPGAAAPSDGSVELRFGPTADARTVRVRDGRTEVVTGPHEGAADQVGGVTLLAAPDLDAAIEAAAAHPVARVAAVEVRPFWQP
jgi:hypothetical protein